jgi:hypothetical protein
LGNFQSVPVKNGKSVIVQASVQVPPDQAARIEHFEFIIRNGKGEEVVDPARFFTKH